MLLFEKHKMVHKPILDLFWKLSEAKDHIRIEAAAKIVTSLRLEAEALKSPAKNSNEVW